MPASSRAHRAGDPGVAGCPPRVANPIAPGGFEAGQHRPHRLEQRRANRQNYSLVVGPNVAALQSKLAQTPALQNITAVSTAGGVPRLQGQARAWTAPAGAADLAQSEVGKTQNQVAVADQRMIAVEVRFAAVATNTMRALRS